MLLEPQETPYDLRFRLFGIPVRVHPMFWLFTTILGWDLMRIGFEYVLLWIACVFVSILVHELGHVFMGLVFGNSGYIVLYSFGGLAVGSNAAGAWWKRVLVSFAGPLAGFILLALLLFGMYLAAPGYFYLNANRIAQPFGLHVPIERAAIFKIQVDPLPPLAADALWFLVQINFYWGILNLLPIWPLDGGQITRAVFTRISRERGLQISLGISFLLAALFAINAVVAMNSADHKGLVPFLPAGGMWMAVMFGMLALQSFMLLQQVAATAYYDPHDPWGGQKPPWER